MAAPVWVRMSISFSGLVVVRFMFPSTAIRAPQAGLVISRGYLLSGMGILGPKVIRYDLAQMGRNPQWAG